MNKVNSVANKNTMWRCNFKAVVLVLMIFGIMIPLCIQVALQFQQSNSNNASKDTEYFTSRLRLFEDMETKISKVRALESHLTELETIKQKTQQALIRLDKKRISLLTEIEQSETTKNALKSEIKIHHRELQRKRKELNFIQQSRSQKIIKNVIQIGVPKKLNIQHEEDVAPEQARKPSSSETIRQCSFSNCFDYSRCSLIKAFSFRLHHSTTAAISTILSSFPEFDETADNPCVHISTFPINQNNTNSSNITLSKGNNIFLLETKERSEEFCHALSETKMGSAILILPYFCESFRLGYDYIIPSKIPDVSNDLWKIMSPLFPIQRNNFLSCPFIFKKSETATSVFHKDISMLYRTDKNISIRTDCTVADTMCKAGWCACKSFNGDLRNSIFILIPIENSNAQFFEHLIDAFSFGSIPVVIGALDSIPFSDVIDMRKAAILFDYQRLPELVFQLKTMPMDDIIALKQQGRFLYTTYFSSKKSMLRTLISHVKSKIGLPPTLLQDSAAVISTVGPKNVENNVMTSLSSLQQLRRNISYVGLSRYRLWNSFPGAINMYPVDPWRLPAPSEVQFLDEGKQNYMPIGDGQGGDGAAFSRSLGGDYAVEQFTVLMLTYDREVILMEALQRLSGMKYLNKVIVVWNNPVHPAADLQWPDIGVKIEVVLAVKNSLNNRFIPYDVIETEAILSMDDDIYLRHDEIELAFRVWRENRDRLVGFPGRHHAYNSSSGYFYYNSEHSCELSLVLTGGAFFHKYYSYVYTYKMDAAVRKMVDDFMNCEDIAMNFLVAHITKKPPVKVTSRWTFRCPGCPASLSMDKDHYTERNQCMEYFQKVYGYNPLKRTQFRADSVLFKTRIPSALSKCFQFV